jgi:hypothetical protein
MDIGDIGWSCHFLDAIYRLTELTRRYQSDHVYGLATIYFMCATIGIFTLAHVFSTYAPASWSRSRIGSKIRAVLRYVSYRGIDFGRPSLRWWSYGMGVTLLIMAGTVYFFGLLNPFF